MNNPVKKYANRGQIVLSADNQRLRIQFPAKIAQQYWQKKQHYWYLSLTDTPQHRLIGEEIITLIKEDIQQSQLDVTGRKYLAKVKTLKSKKEFQEKLNVSIPIFVPKQKSLTELYYQYKNYQKSILAETTYLNMYDGVYRRAIEKCPQQDIEKGLEIRQYLIDNYSSQRVKRILGVIASMIDWSKEHNLIPWNFTNLYRRYAQDIKVIKEEEEYPQQIQALIDEGIWTPPHHLVKGFTKEEANIIIQAFDERQCRNLRNDTPWDYVMRFLFWTGCRHGECAALRWKHVAPDFSSIRIERSFDKQSKLETDTKKHETRTFPCGPKLQELLQRIKPKNAQGIDLVFTNCFHDYINFGTLNLYWVGQKAKGKKGYIPGILPQLIEEGLVKNYQNPYATRHTYINIQLEAGVKPKDVAVLVGNSAGTIAKYYESISRGVILPIEL